MERNQDIVLVIYPFENLTEGHTLDVFCRSFYIDLVTELSRFRQFRIISFDSISHPNTGLLEFDYAIMGSFRYIENRLRINAQLLNTETSHIPWADHFEGEKESIFSIQDQLLREIVSSLQLQLNYDLITQVRKKSPVSLSAYESWLYGMEELKRGTAQSDELARSYFERAIEVAPSYSLAYSGMSLTFFNEWSCQVWDRWDECQKGAFAWAQKAILLDEQNYVAASVLGRVYLYDGEFEKAEHYLRLSLRLNSNDIDNLVNVASSLAFLGYPEESEALYEKVLLLNPLSANQYNQIGAFIAFECGKYEKCVALAANARPTWVDFPAYVAAAYYELGDRINMNRYWEMFVAEVAAKIVKSPNLSSQEALQWMIGINPFKGRARIASFWEYMKGDHVNEVKPFLISSASHDNSFRKEGDLWEVTFDGKISRVPDMKGLQDLAKLLQRQELPVHCSELLGSRVVNGEPEFVFDEKARRSYQQKIVKLQEEISIAEKENDFERGSNLQSEYDQIVGHLTASLGLGGRIRKTNDHIDKARSAVTWRIRKAIDKLMKLDTSLGKHLSASVRTGVFCTYAPEKPMRWILDD